MEGIKSQLLEMKEKLEGNLDKSEKREDKQGSHIIANGPCPTGLEDRDEDLEIARRLFSGLQGELQSKEDS